MHTLSVPAHIVICWSAAESEEGRSATQRPQNRDVIRIGRIDLMY